MDAREAKASPCPRHGGRAGPVTLQAVHPRPPGPGFLLQVQNLDSPRGEHGQHQVAPRCGAGGPHT